MASSPYQGENLKSEIQQVGDLYQAIAPDLAFYATPRQLQVKKSSKLKVGFLSSYIASHSVGKVIGPVIARLDTAKFDVVVFTMKGAKEDDATKEYTQSSMHIRLPSKGEKARSIIADHALDVLVFAEVGLLSLQMSF
jgi:predicted O-linked N-acetylglucosamine transferase (SPINDLY family)